MKSPDTELRELTRRVEALEAIVKPAPEAEGPEPVAWLVEWPGGVPQLVSNPDLVHDACANVFPVYKPEVTQAELEQARAEGYEAGKRDGYNLAEWADCGIVGKRDSAIPAEVVAVVEAAREYVLAGGAILDRWDPMRDAVLSLLSAYPDDAWKQGVEPEVGLTAEEAWGAVRFLRAGWPVAVGAELYSGTFHAAEALRNALAAKRARLEKGGE